MLIRPISNDTTTVIAHNILKTECDLCAPCDEISCVTKLLII